MTYIASFNNKLPEVTAPVESHRSAISEWVTPTINLHEGPFGQEGGQSLRQMMPDTDHGASCRGQIFSESDSASPLTMLRCIVLLGELTEVLTLDIKIQQRFIEGKHYLYSSHTVTGFGKSVL